MKIQFRIVVVAVPMLLLLPLQITRAQESKKPMLVSAEQLDIASALPNPPAMDSAQTRTELVELHKLDATRTAKEFERAKADDAEEDIFIIKSIFIEKFSRETLPMTAFLSDHVHNNEGMIVNPAKGNVFSGMDSEC